MNWHRYNTRKDYGVVMAMPDSSIHTRKRNYGQTLTMPSSRPDYSWSSLTPISVTVSSSTVGVPRLDSHYHEVSLYFPRQDGEGSLQITHEIE